MRLRFLLLLVGLGLFLGYIIFGYLRTWKEGNLFLLISGLFLCFMLGLMIWSMRKEYYSGKIQEKNGLG